MSIIPENGKRYETDAETVSGNKIVIVTTPTGYYKIDVEGVGQKPAVCNELFTNLRDARIAKDRYVMDHAAELNKQRLIERVAGPKPAKIRKKNG